MDFSEQIVQEAGEMTRLRADLGLSPGGKDSCHENRFGLVQK